MIPIRYWVIHHYNFFVQTVIKSHCWAKGFHPFQSFCLLAALKISFQSLCRSSQRFSVDSCSLSLDDSNADATHLEIFLCFHVRHHMIRWHDQITLTNITRPADETVAIRTLQFFAVRHGDVRICIHHEVVEYIAPIEYIAWRSGPNLPGIRLYIHRLRTQRICHALVLGFFNFLSFSGQFLETGLL